jgi:uncharacterized protein (TIGR03435 family)
MRYASDKLVSVVAAIAVAAIAAAAQAPPAHKPQFEVASVKPNKSGNLSGGGLRPQGDRFVATNVTLRMLLQFAYRPQDGTPMLNDRLVGGPAWMDSDHFDVQAKLEQDARAIPQEQIRLMLQSLLEDRFQVKAHWETRDLPVYILTIGKGGPKLKLSEDQTPPAPVTTRPPQRPGEAPVLPRGVFSVMPAPSGMMITGTAIPFSNIIGFIQVRVGRRIFDKTDLKGLYDIRLQFADSLSAPPAAVSTTGEPTPLPEPSAPPLAVALDELGLKLDSTKMPLEVLVIDSVQKPSEN